jgi:hypothetical protein
MQKRSSKPRDVNAMAAAIAAQATDPEDLGDDLFEGKNPATVELGWSDGKKGGKARAEKLRPGQRSAVAGKAADARWRRSGGSSEGV